ncbi:hypothetical protein BDN70DRAFT_996247 [Pholiota conissans]|uniref:Peptidase S9 prolyl oligopeptidase catalytic domain-containing protein n=1 Tax=Pholiota conissans TaxID=109636 RepID=A0A9P5YXI0_9AGAR|nr:hypothetical protein BDN70DRAFT_996247 [Pholiota conissans]
MQSDPTLFSRHHSWYFDLDSTWDVLGPFPIHAREQHFLSPAFPLNLSKPIEYEESWPSAYADGGTVKWSKTTSTPEGDIEISFPKIRWESLRATEGWAALQHHAILRATLTAHPPAVASRDDIPNVLVELKQASYFMFRPQEYDRSTFTPRWFAGNIYNLVHALPHVVPLPVPPSTTQPTKYDIFVSGDYEIRLFGDPLVNHSEVPVQKLSIHIQPQDENIQIVHQQSQDVVCDFVDGYAFGNVIGIGIQSSNRWWTIKNVSLNRPTNGVNIKLVDNQSFIAPLQTRVIALYLEQSAPFMAKEIDFNVMLQSGSLIENLSLSIPISQRRLSSLRDQPLKGTFLLARTSASAFLAVSPTFDNIAQTPPILALHGAGVDIFGQDFWIESLPVSNSSWMIAVSGRTSWGLDWHGPSTNDVWSALDSLANLVHDRRFNFPASWIFPKDTKVVLMGHSNGGQGTWHIASRFPDRVLAAIPAAGYMKSQMYVSLMLARSRHFIDPALLSILETSLTPDDNDLHITNLVDIPMLVIHGGNDENVPVWHSRELVGTLKSWYPSANVTYLEDIGGSHWYPTILKRPEVQMFLASIFSNQSTTHSDSFVLTVANPRECGPLHGWKVDQLLIPGRLARLHIRKMNQYRFSVEPFNVLTFSISTGPTPYEIFIGDQILAVRRLQTETRIHRVQPGKWQVTDSSIIRRRQPPGRIQSILSTSGPMTIIVSSQLFTDELSVAQRLAHVLHLYHKIDSEIVPENALACGSWPSGNVVFISRPSSLLAEKILAKNLTSVGITDNIIHIGWRQFNKSEHAVLFTHPHPMQEESESFILFIMYNEISGLERATRLFPFRTGVAVPDWVVVDTSMDTFGAGGIQAAGVWDADWKLSEPMSW